MISFLKSLLRKSCFFCKGKSGYFLKYLNDAGQKVYVCSKCVMYAERRALRKR